MIIKLLILYNTLKTMFFLTEDIRNLILDFSDINGYWERRFTNDVLPLINKNYKLISIVDGNPCGFCYASAILAGENHLQCDACKIDRKNDFTFLSFNEFKKINNLMFSKSWKVLFECGADMSLIILNNVNHYRQHNIAREIAFAHWCKTYLEK